MNKLILLILFILLPITQIRSQSSSLNKLTDRIIELNQVSKDKQSLIDQLAIEINNLTLNSAAYNKENKKLRETIQNKTEELIILRRELNDIIIEFDQLKEDVVALSALNNEYKEIIEDLNENRQKLTDRISQADKEINGLYQLLTQKEYENELLIASEKALSKRIDDIINANRTIAFLEISATAPDGFDFSAAAGRLLNGYNIYLGAKIGYAKFTQSFNSNLDISLLPISLEAKISIGKTRLNFEYVDLNETFYSKRKFYLAFRIGYSPRLNSGPSSFINIGGPHFGTAVCMILNSNESANLYIISGIDLNILGNINSLGDRSFSTYPRFRIGVGGIFNQLEK